MPPGYNFVNRPLLSKRVCASPPHSVVPPQCALVKNEFIPGEELTFSTNTDNYPISTRFVHDNPNLFRESASYNPDCWLGEKGKELERWKVSFSKGPRQCVGINLENMEIPMTLAVFFADFDMGLPETEEKTMEWLDHGVA